MEDKEFNFIAPQFLPILNDGIVRDGRVNNFFGTRNEDNKVEIQQENCLNNSRRISSSCSDLHKLGSTIGNTEATESTVLQRSDSTKNINLQKTEVPYVSLAEAVLKFQTCTPKRFHSQNYKRGSGVVPKKKINVKLEKPQNTVPQPFSFEERHKQLLKKKEEKIQKYLEVEKKMREFHANKLPKYLASSSTNSNLSSGSTNSAASKENINECKQFKAKPATVLHKPPFVPKHEKVLIEVQGFNFESDVRAMKRKEFEAKMKEKELLSAMLMEKMEAEKKAEEEKIRLEQRKKAEHKANPIRKYKPLIKCEAKPLTQPITPKAVKNYL